MVIANTQTGLQRCGKSCRLRWINYLRPDLKRGSFSSQEEQIIIDIHRIVGNRWAQIAKHLPGRTDNEVKNFWNSCVKKKLLSQGLDPKTHNLISSHQRSTSNNKVACNIINLSQTYQKPPKAVLSQVTGSVSMEVDPPFVTLPPLPPTQPPFHQAKIHNPIVWTVKDQNSHDLITFPCGSSIESTPISSSSSSSLNPYAFGFLDKNCIWGTNGAEHYEAPRMEDVQPQKEHEQKDKICEVETDKYEELKGGQDMDTSFDSSSFDLEFLESTLMSGTMSRDLSSIDDLAWNF
ncbi:hypothetical protein L1049_005502 [Liquidambar formosana]|uniref:Uncharacterized protein n=1 Tax=Liquidambar formosana TaxID=63359 RepID=A0AAP0N6K7_LIQFO